MNILKLAKNLKEFTLDEIEMLAEMDCKTALNHLLKANKIEFKNGFYKYKEPKKVSIFKLVEPPELKTGGRIFFKDAVNGYLTNRKLTKDTLTRYKSILKFNIIPQFGEMFLDEITHSMIKDFMKNLHKKYKPKTVSNCITLTGSILKWAFEEGLIEYNPYLGVKNTTPEKKGITR